MNPAALFFDLVLAVLAIGSVAYGVIAFNGLVALRNDIARTWSNIDVLLKQRADEVPNLVATVKGYAAHEKDVLQRAVDARAQLARARSVPEVGAADAQMRAALGGLFAVAEAYPQLRASEAFLRLQKRITELEDEIADRREVYNDTVTAYNNRLATLPDMFFAALLGMRKDKPLFSAVGSDREMLFEIA